MTKNQTLEKKISELPPSAISKLETYIDLLLAKVKKESGGRLKQDWAGGIKEWKDQ